MAQALGYVTKTETGGYEGTLATMSLKKRIRILPNRAKESEAQPDFRVYTEDRVEIGGGWNRVGKVKRASLSRPLSQVNRAQSKEGQDCPAFARHITGYTGTVAIKGIAETGDQHPTLLDDVERGAEQEVERQKRECGERPGGHGEAAVREKVVEEHGVPYPSVVAVNQQP